MEHNKAVIDMVPGDEVEGYYVLKDAALKTTSTGKPFLSGAVSDATGAVEIKVWDYSGPIGGEDAGKVIMLRGLVSEFRGTTQINVNRLRLAEPGDSYDLADLVPVAPIDPQERLREVEDFAASIEDEDYRRVAEAMLSRHRDSFAKIPAAKSVHHSFINGLLMHTSNMLRIADFLADIYPGVLDRSLLLAGTLLHDLAKAQEFTFSGLGLVTGYSLKGELIGHLVLCAQEAAEVAKETGMPEEKSVLLQHMLLSHHGDPEFGAAVRPMCAEAELLAEIDRIDSRMEIYEETFLDVPPGEFSERIFALDKRIYNHGAGEMPPE